MNRSQLEAQCAQDRRSSRLENAVHTVRSQAPGDTKKQRRLLWRNFFRLIKSLKPQEEVFLRIHGLAA